VRQACPPLPLIPDNLIATLVNADSDAAFSYARCQAGHAAAVQAYDNARDAQSKGGK
jgi:hypothetical protein